MNETIDDFIEDETEGNDGVTSRMETASDSGFEVGDDEEVEWF